jgi:hypothetical protein
MIAEDLQLILIGKFGMKEEFANFVPNTTAREECFPCHLTGDSGE